GRRRGVRRTSLVSPQNATNRPGFGRATGDADAEPAAPGRPRPGVAQRAEFALVDARQKAPHGHARGLDELFPAGQLVRPLAQQDPGAGVGDSARYLPRRAGRRGRIRGHAVPVRAQRRIMIRTHRAGLVFPSRLRSYFSPVHCSRHLPAGMVCTSPRAMDSYRETAFYLAVWYAILAALGAVLLIVLHDVGPAFGLLIAANSALLFALFLLVLVGRLSDRCITRGQFWGALPAQMRQSGEASRRMARRAAEQTWLRFAKGAAMVAI